MKKSGLTMLASVKPLRISRWVGDVEEKRSCETSLLQHGPAPLELAMSKDAMQGPDLLSAGVDGNAADRRQCGDPQLNDY